MIIRRGDKDELSGNAVVYWDVEGENFLNPGHEIIAVNFTISVLPVDDKFLTATFPPVTLTTYNDLIESLSKVKCDIIYAGKVTIPEEDAELNKFYKKEFVKFNRLVEEYTKKFKEQISININTLPEKEQLHLLIDMSQKIRSDLEQEKINTKDKDMMLKIINLLEEKYSKYDLNKFSKYIFKPGEKLNELINLYTKKYLAIYHEEYENAGNLKEKIKKIENEIDFGYNDGFRYTF